MRKTTPSNQYTSDEREQVCWDLYIESIRKGTPNAKASALKAGYSEPHSDNITLQGWFKGRSDKLRRVNMLSRAEKNLEKVLLMDTQSEGKEIPELLRIQVDVSKTIVTTLGKNEGYTTREEITGSNGKDLIPEKMSPEKQLELLNLLNK